MAVRGEFQATHPTDDPSASGAFTASNNLESPTSMTDPIAHNLATITAEIAAACARADRLPSEVQLVAVTKYAQPSWIERLIELGLRDLGESRPQQLVQRAAGFPTDIRWHLIGHLQRNKVKQVLPQTSLIHSVDSLRLLEQISEVAAGLSLRPRVLLEVNVSGESAKDGLSAAQLQSQWPAFQALPHVEIVGLMTMAPLADRPEAARPVFRELRNLRDDLAATAAPHVRLCELSMGMSGDFSVAIEEGATIVRIGSRLFENMTI